MKQYYKHISAFFACSQFSLDPHMVSEYRASRKSWALLDLNNSKKRPAAAKKMLPLFRPPGPTGWVRGRGCHFCSCLIAEHYDPFPVFLLKGFACFPSFPHNKLWPPLVSEPLGPGKSMLICNHCAAARVTEMLGIQDRDSKLLNPVHAEWERSRDEPEDNPAVRVCS